jgi:hypothetical protein
MMRLGQNALSRRHMRADRNALRNWAGRPEFCVLCRPLGGLNDTLVQISACLDFAIRTNRQLVLDLSRPVSGFQIDAKKVFCPTPAIANVHSHLRIGLDSGIASGSGDLYPEELESLEYDVVYSGVSAMTPSGRLLLLPEFDVPHRTVVHEAWGGGWGHTLALNALALEAELSREVKNRVALLPPLDWSVHLRFTDIKVDLRSCLEALRPSVFGNVFLASDSEVAVEAAIRSWEHANIIYFPTRRSKDSKSLHRQGLRYDTIIDLWADLYALTSARRLHVCPLDMVTLKKSGFGRLAERLHVEHRLRHNFFGF